MTLLLYLSLLALHLRVYSNSLLNVNVEKLFSASCGLRSLVGTVLILLIGAANRFCFITKYRLSAVVFVETSMADAAQRGSKSAWMDRWAGIEKLRDLKKRLLGFWVLKGSATAVVRVEATKCKALYCASSEGSHSTNDDRTNRLAPLKWFLLTVTAPAASAKSEGCVLKTLTFAPLGT